MKAHRWTVTPTVRGPHSHTNILGDPKIRHTQEQAERRAMDEGSNAYRCRACGGWHVGGVRPQRRAS